MDTMRSSPSTAATSLSQSPPLPPLIPIVESSAPSTSISEKQRYFTPLEGLQELDRYHATGRHITPRNSADPYNNNHISISRTGSVIGKFQTSLKCTVKGFY